MENPEEILHCLEEFSKLKPKDIPRELEDYLCFVAKTGDPVYQWGTIKSLFKEKLINVITDFYESCPSVEIPPCPNVEVFNYESMKSFILEKLDTFAAAPFTVQRICELLTTPRKEYNRIDKYMRALEKNILVVSTTEPGNRRTTENGEGMVVNGLESEHLLESNNTNNDINVEEMDDTPVWSRITSDEVTYRNTDTQSAQTTDTSHPLFTSDARSTDASISHMDSVIACRTTEEQPYVSIEPVASDSCVREKNTPDSGITVTITAIPAAVQKRRDSIEPVVSSEDNSEQTSEHINIKLTKKSEETTSSSIDIEAPLQESSFAQTEAENTADISTTTTSEIDVKQAESSSSSESSAVVSAIISIPTSNIAELDSSEKIQVSESVDDLQSSDVMSEFTTVVSSTNEVPHSTHTDTAEILSDDSKEGSVTSTDDISNNAVELELIREQSNESDDDVSKSSVEEGNSSDLLVECSTNMPSTIDRNEVDDDDDDIDNNDDVDDERFATSSTSPMFIVVDISEDSCQEPPIRKS